MLWSVYITVSYHSTSVNRLSFLLILSYPVCVIRYALSTLFSWFIQVCNIKLFRLSFNISKYRKQTAVIFAVLVYINAIKNIRKQTNWAFLYRFLIQQYQYPFIILIPPCSVIQEIKRVYNQSFIVIILLFLNFTAAFVGQFSLKTSISVGQFSSERNSSGGLLYKTQKFRIMNVLIIRNFFVIYFFINVRFSYINSKCLNTCFVILHLIDM